MHHRRLRGRAGGRHEQLGPAAVVEGCDGSAALTEILGERLAGEQDIGRRIRERLEAPAGIAPEHHDRVIRGLRQVTCYHHAPAMVGDPRRAGIRQQRPVGLAVHVQRRVDVLPAGCARVAEEGELLRRRRAGLSHLEGCPFTTGAPTVRGSRRYAHVSPPAAFEPAPMSVTFESAAPSTGCGTTGRSPGAPETAGTITAATIPAASTSTAARLRARVIACRRRRDDIAAGRHGVATAATAATAGGRRPGLVRRQLQPLRPAPRVELQAQRVPARTHRARAVRATTCFFRRATSETRAFRVRVNWTVSVFPVSFVLMWRRSGAMRFVLPAPGGC